MHHPAISFASIQTDGSGSAELMYSGGLTSVSDDET